MAGAGIGTNGELTLEAKAAIRKYLLQLAAIAGLPTLALFAYLLFQHVPSVAVEQARQAINRQVDVLYGSVVEGVTQALIEIGEARAGIEGVQTRLTAVESSLMEVETRVELVGSKVRALESKPSVRIGEIIRTLESSPDTTSIMTHLTSLEASVQEMRYETGRAVDSLHVADEELNLQIFALRCKVQGGELRVDGSCVTPGRSPETARPLTQ